MNAIIIAKSVGVFFASCFGAVQFFAAVDDHAGPIALGLAAFASTLVAGLFIAALKRGNRDLADCLLFGSAMGIGLAMRLHFLEIETGDLATFRRYHDQLWLNGWWNGLREEFGNSNGFYVTLLSLTSLLAPNGALAAKFIGLFFEPILAYFTFKIIRRSTGERRSAAVGGLVAYLSPTLILNASAWGQWDAVYGSMLLGFVYYLLRFSAEPSCAANQLKALVFFGLAFAAKLQSVFLIIPFLVFLTKKESRIAGLIVVPAIYLACNLLPILAGRSPVAVLTVYSGQVDAHTQLSLGAANLFQFFKASSSTFLTTLSLAVCGLAVLFFWWMIVWTNRRLSKSDWLLLAVISALLLPYLLPRMHERYFFVAEHLAIPLAFTLRRYWYVPMVIMAASVYSYAPFLDRTFRADLTLPAAALAVLCGKLIYDFFGTDVLSELADDIDRPSDRRVRSLRE